jgi:hypothetical protein
MNGTPRLPLAARLARLDRTRVLWMALLVAALLLAASLAVAGDPSSTSAVSNTGTRGVPSVAVGADSVVVHGTAPVPGDRRVPRAWLPPGSVEADPGPSDVVFPPQSLTIRFNHGLHVKSPAGPRMACDTCHAAAKTSESVRDVLTPRATTCDGCHLSDHTTRSAVTPGPDASGQCAFCHTGYKPGDGNTVARFALPRANMVFNHRKHVARNIGCPQCHGAVEELELATRDQMPRMRGCFGCHQKTDAAARGEAKSDCLTCHVKNTAARGSGTGGRMQTAFPSGVLFPPRWLHDAAHTPDWIDRHKAVAGTDSQFCSNCHKEDFCVECHDGRIRPRSIHPGDYISMHPIEARQATSTCTSCHNEQSFCLACHQRTGVSMSGPPDARMSSRFHPPKSVWSDAPRRPGHHGFEAERNLNACVSCHVERDCVVCHGGQGIGGGFDPHRAGFAGGCATQLRRNPRPCFVCHEPGDGVLQQCR